jgi:GAF domain-containing protein
MPPSQPPRQTLIERERSVLRDIARGVPLAEVLDQLLRAVEAEASTPMLASILFISDDGKHLLHGAAPSLPEAYNKAIHGIAIGDGVGSCGTAAARAEPVYVSDIANDPLWADFRDLALAHGLRACWSTPIEGEDGKILGTFAVYHTSPRGPTPDELESIGMITDAVRRAIEAHRARR